MMITKHIRLSRKLGYKGMQKNCYQNKFIKIGKSMKMSLKIILNLKDETYNEILKAL